MSLYGALFGRNNQSDILLAMLDIDQPGGKWRSGRFRDIYLSGDGTRVLLYTRNGGGNRGCWGENGWNNTKDEQGVCQCPGCAIGVHLPKHPNYIRDYDDDFDSTYATIEFTVPKEYADACVVMATGEEPATVSERFLALIGALDHGAGEEVTE